MHPESTSTIPAGFCQCGCGGRTPIATRTQRRQHQFKGKPNRFIQGHHLCPRTNDFTVRDDGAPLILLTQGKVAVIDAVDLDLVRQYRYYAHISRGRWYASRNVTRSDGTRTVTSMHRDIFGETEDTVDHADGDGLNNRRSNLREADRSEQAQNRGRRVGQFGPKGVTYRPERLKNPWVARLGAKHLGAFSTEQEASDAYDLAATEAYGEFARGNRP